MHKHTHTILPRCASSYNSLVFVQGNRGKRYYQSTFSCQFKAEMIQNATLLVSSITAAKRHVSHFKPCPPVYQRAIKNSYIYTSHVCHIRVTHVTCMSYTRHTYMSSTPVRSQRDSDDATSIFNNMNSFINCTQI